MFDDIFLVGIQRKVRCMRKQLDVHVRVRSNTVLQRKVKTCHAKLKLICQNLMQLIEDATGTTKTLLVVTCCNSAPPADKKALAMTPA